MNDLAIREARPEELEALGQLMVLAYSSLDGFPGPSEQPAYFELLGNVGRLRGPDTTLLVATLDDKLVGGIVYFGDMTPYGTAASQEQATSAFRLLAVHPDARGLGVGKALARHCIELARARQHRQVVIHTTDAQQVARACTSASASRARRTSTSSRAPCRSSGFASRCRCRRRDERRPCRARARTKPALGLVLLVLEAHPAAPRRRGR